MAVIQVPTGLSVGRQPWGQKRNDLSFSSSFGSQAVETSPPQWQTTLVATPKRPALFQVMMMQLRGRTNQLALWNMGRPVPLGTMRGAMTVAAVAQGATVLPITASGQAGKTLLAGDFLGVGSGLNQQVVMVIADATANGAGLISVTVEPPLRNAFAAGSGVTWDKPKALFRRNDSVAQWEHLPGRIVQGMQMDLIEDWRP